MSCLRVTAGNRAQPANSACAATGPAQPVATWTLKLVVLTADTGINIGTEPLWSKDTNRELPGLESKNIDPPSPEVSPTHPVSTECISLPPTDLCDSTQATSIADDVPTYEELQTASPSAQTTQLQLTYQPSVEEQIQPSQVNLIPLELDTDDQQLVSQAQGDTHSEMMEPDNKASPDNIMTVWQLSPIAGQKFQRSPDPECHGAEAPRCDPAICQICTRVISSNLA
ncbi:hypothetical protein K3495_g4359 [Podosphaera aphanis]|nr:hypothetical protein K3495_g4359 [Podosphaera aphanis]